MAVMTEKAFNIALKSLSFPLYIFKETKVGYTCDRLAVVDESTKAFERVRYLITGRTQCSCIGWMKTKGCKHLRMLLEDHTDSIPNELANDEATKLMEVLKGVNPDEIEASLAESPRVGILRVELKVKKPPAERIAYVKHGGGGSMLVTIKFVKE